VKSRQPVSSRRHGAPHDLLAEQFAILAPAHVDDPLDMSAPEKSCAKSRESTTENLETLSTMRETWRHTRRPLVLAANDVHVWRIGLDRENWSTSLTSGPLADDEVARARRFRFEDDRRRFVVCRVDRRMILSRYLDCSPAEIRFRIGAHGKPFLDPATHGELVRFNVSHSHELALVAVATSEVGVDIERVRPLEDVDAIVARHFSHREQAAFTQAAPAERLRTFFRQWTLKEAWLKASGVGLSGPLNAVDVTIGGHRPARLLTDDAEWSVRLLRPSVGYVAALAVAGREHRVRLLSGRA
jgi:4'-phosphopantetheinyl transferase